jgi:hypothetical protein
VRDNGAICDGRFAGLINKLQEWLDDIDGHWKNHGGVLFGANLC